LHIGRVARWELRPDLARDGLIESSTAPDAAGLTWPLMRLLNRGSCDTAVSSMIVSAAED